MFSIIMPAYNSAQTIQDSISSVLNQTYSCFELIIVDDFSNDNTIEVINSFNDKRIKLLKNESNKGVAFSRNKGIKEAKNRYIAFLDSDDLWLPEKLEYQYKYLSSGSTVVCSAYNVFKDNPSDISNPIFFKENFSYNDMLKSNHIGNLTGVYDSFILGKFFQENIGHEDYVMWLSIVKKAKSVYCIPQSLALYRKSGGSISANKFKAMKWQIDIYRKHLNLNIVQTLYNFSQYVLFALKKRNK